MIYMNSFSNISNYVTYIHQNIENAWLYIEVSTFSEASQITWGWFPILTYSYKGVGVIFIAVRKRVKVSTCQNKELLRGYGEGGTGQIPLPYFNKQGYISMKYVLLWTFHYCEATL